MAFALNNRTFFSLDNLAIQSGAWHLANLPLRVYGKFWVFGKKS